MACYLSGISDLNLEQVNIYSGGAAVDSTAQNKSEVIPTLNYLLAKEVNNVANAILDTTGLTSWLGFTTFYYSNLRDTKTKAQNEANEVSEVAKTFLKGIALDGSVFSKAWNRKVGSNARALVELSFIPRIPEGVLKNSLLSITSDKSGVKEFIELLRFQPYSNLNESDTLKIIDTVFENQIKSLIFKIKQDNHLTLISSSPEAIKNYISEQIIFFNNLKKIYAQPYTISKYDAVRNSLYRKTKALSSKLNSYLNSIIDFAKKELENSQKIALAEQQRIKEGGSGTALQQSRLNVDAAYDDKSGKIILENLDIAIDSHFTKKQYQAGFSDVQAVTMDFDNKFDIYTGPQAGVTYQDETKKDFKTDSNQNKEGFPLPLILGVGVAGVLAFTAFM